MTTPERRYANETDHMARRDVAEHRDERPPCAVRYGSGPDEPFIGCGRPDGHPGPHAPAPTKEDRR